MKNHLAFLALLVLLISITLTGAIGVQASGTKPSIREARKHAEETLLPLEGIAGVSHRENPPRIIVYLEHEKYKDRIPDEILGYKTEVIVIGKIKALSLLQLEEAKPLAYAYPSPVIRTGRVRPLVGGVSLGVSEDAFGGKMAGTLGLIVQGVDGEVYILTNAHVIAMNRKAQFLPIGTAVLQPGTYDGGTIQDKVGELCKYVKITFGPKGKNYADAAIAKVTIGDYLIGEVLGSDNLNTYTVSGVTEVNLGDFVRKSGRTTGVTENTVTDVNATVKV